MNTQLQNAYTHKYTYRQHLLYLYTLNNHIYLPLNDKAIKLTYKKIRLINLISLISNNNNINDLMLSCARAQPRLTKGSNSHWTVIRNSRKKTLPQGRR